MLVPHEFSILVNSNPSQGAINVSSDGSAFEVQLDDPLTIPNDALNVTVTAEESTVWWTVPNIITGVNDTMYIFGDNDAAGTELFTITIPQGLYDLTAFNNTILSLLEAAGARTEDGGGNPLPLVSFSADTATQKVILRLNYDNVTVDFSQPNTPYEILGFDQVVYSVNTPAENAPIDKLAPNVAQFNQVNYFLIACDLVQKGIRFNNQYNQVVTQVLIDVAPGSQIVSTPFNPPKINSQELAGVKRTNLRFRITDDQLRPINTNGEYWSTRLVIRYLLPMKEVAV